MTVNEQPVTQFRSAKSRALLAYLAAQPDREHARATLATLLWGDLADSNAKTNLRIELSNLNKVLGKHPALNITRNAVRFDHAWATVDVVDFRAAVTHFLALPIESQMVQLAQLTTALAGYQGEFLAGLHVDNALEFEEWQLLMREQLHEQAMQALTLLQQRHAEQGNWPALAAAARRQLALVPWQESAHRNLIQALVAQGQRVAALEQYEKCCAILHAELGVEPTLATQAIVARLRGGKPTTAATTHSGTRQSSAPHAVIRHNLPQQLKSLVGRTAEISNVYALVQQAQLVTLLGLGGVGKSRLALAVAQQALHDFADGVWFVSLAHIAATESAPNRSALAIAAALGFPVTDMQAPLTELAAHLADKELLLILDNWDELTAAAEQLCAHLLANPGVHLLATSRVRLLVEEERVVQLQGLPPEEALTLFVERARRIVPTFAGEGQEVAIGQICDAVAGLPLGIELAASWVEHFSVAEIGQSLSQIAVAPNSADEYVARHQTLDGVFAYSWQLLSPPQQQLLARLATFRGGFDRSAVRVVAEGNLSDLSLLIAHSLVQRISAGRYDLHPLVQEFAQNKLSATERVRLDQRHSQYYLTLLHTREERGHLFIEFENMRSAWQR
ncbi:MAG: NACHT domain-containing protein, partial [Caldilineaceae bacterium]|nr:NACHT domain-containing protein [Caldilineaceae bacterium]